MKNKLIIVTIFFIALTGFIVGQNQLTKSQKVSSSQIQMKEIKPNDGHQRLPLECKKCHTCDFPTKRNPCLINCPRKELITVEHKPEEGPAYVVLNNKGKRYGKVVFSHLIHAQMSDISIGCDGCHHYNIAGPIEKCENCHNQSRKRNDISRPDLTASFHRQCYNCHKDWSHSNDCSYCHLPIQNENEEIINKKIKNLIGKTHPEYASQPRIVYETNYNDGKIVTFNHSEHVTLFGIACKTCHKNDRCTKCHDVDITYDKPRKHDLKGQPFEIVHQNCINCHKDNSCNKCHQNEIKEKFDHKQTGFDLGKHHSKLACNKCHTKMNPIEKLNPSCNSCHKDFVQGKFNHRKTGLILDDIHKEFDCESCHPKNNFSLKPVCTDCHDNYIYPKQKPGKIVSK